MKPHPNILYLNTDPGSRIPQTTLDGIRRYAGVRGWEADAFSSEESRRTALSALLASRAPVVGCIYECSDDNIAQPSTFKGIPVVYLHAKKAPRGANTAWLPTDNAAVAETAFRELSAERPSTFATVGHAGDYEWSKVRERAFAALAEKARVVCRSFPHRLTEQPGARAERLRSWVAGLQRRTAIFAVNDVVAAEVVTAARAAFRSIPRELTLLSVDNLPHICEVSEPTISSIQIDFERAGYVAASMIGEMAGRGKVASAASAVVLPLMAVRRDSTSGWGRREHFVLEAVERIRREACDGLTADDVIKASPVSRSLFILRFREAVGHSIQNEIEHVRLERVFTLLRDTETPIGAIASFCGWRSDIALRWLFKRRTGMSMRQWRQKNT